MKTWWSNGWAAWTALLLVLTPGCSSEENDGATAVPDSGMTERLATLESQYASMQRSIEALQTACEAGDAALSEALGTRQKELEALRDDLQQQIDNLKPGVDPGELLERLETVDAELAAVQARMEIHAQQIGALNQTIMGMQMQLDAVQGVVGGKVDQALYDAFVTETNTHILQALTALSSLNALCDGFEEGTTVKGYVDNAVAAVTAQLGSYVLRDAYDAFCAEYGTFKNGIEERMAAAESNLALLKELILGLEGGSSDIGDLLELQTKVSQLEAKVAQLGDLNTLFTKENESFRNGVNAILADALAEGGAFDTALTERLEALSNDYTEALEEINRRLDAIEGRLDNLEEQMKELIGRIQSLVYVPKTSDGKIHIGTTHIAVVGEDGTESGDRIDLTPTKKLEYRVSPANLRDKLLELPLSAFAFYQEHVTRAENEGMDEFHICKIEPGNGPGEIFVTVENDHDFTHEDLAVALCIKAESKGVTTEFTSPYTTVIGEGRNIRDRFYLARRTASGYEPSRDDMAYYLVRYDDTKSLVTLLGDYELVYDNGESCMSLEEARERFEWDVTLSMLAEGVADAFESTLRSGTFTVTPSQPNETRQQPVTVGLRSGSDYNNEGHTVTDRYRIAITDGRHSVTLIPEFRVSVIACAGAYQAERSNVSWNYATWRAVTGRTTGTAEYTAQVPTRFFSRKGALAVNYDLSYLPERVAGDLFGGGVWNVTGADAVQQRELQVRSAATGVDGTHRTHTLAVGGFVYCDGMQLLQLTRNNVKPSCLVSPEGINLTASVALTGPVTRTVTVNAAATTATAGSVALFYFAANPQATSQAAKRITYTNEELSTYFGGSVADADNFLAGGTLRNNTQTNPAWTAAGSDVTLPVTLTLLRAEDGLLIRPSLVMTPSTLASRLEAGASLTFTAPEGCAYMLPDGPSFPIEGSITISKPAQ